MNKKKKDEEKPAKNEILENTGSMTTGRTITLQINGETQVFSVGYISGSIAPSHTLAHTLRETLDLTGTKIGCDKGACGACTVLMDGKPVPSCMILTVECDGKSIITIEGLQELKTGSLHPLQQAFVDHTAFQCGFCTPGILMTSKALVENNPSPKKHDIKEALSGHYCRCISHYHVVDAVSSVIKKGD